MRWIALEIEVGSIFSHGRGGGAGYRLTGGVHRARPVWWQPIPRDLNFKLIAIKLGGGAIGVEPKIELKIDIAVVIRAELDQRT